MRHIEQEPLSRLDRIAKARQVALSDHSAGSSGLIEPWIEQSWQRCMSRGLRFQDKVVFEAVSRNHMAATAEGNRQLVETARPIIRQLARAIAQTRYFAILTNHQGVVVDVDGAMDPSDARVTSIARVGVDLSEESVGTTAISAALTELRPVWLHRGEHFFKDTSVYSCAGAPLFGPDGRCVGMLDLTGVETAERPELRHLVSQSVRLIEDAMVQKHPHALMMRINWPGSPIGMGNDGLIGLDQDGQVVCANQTARVLVPELQKMQREELHCRDVFATPYEQLFDSAHRQQSVEAPLWSGLRMQIQAQRPGSSAGRSQVAAQTLSGVTNVAAASTHAPGLKELETSLIRQAVQDHKGNVAEAARALGVSRATVYRKLKTKR